MSTKPDEHSVILGGGGRNRPPGTTDDPSHPDPNDAGPGNEDLMSLPKGTVLGERYEIIGELGSGGFGIVYEARDREASDDIVAIKEYVPEMCVRHLGSQTVSPRLSRDKPIFEKGLEAFAAEARTLLQLDHPNIVRVFHWFRQHGTAYIVMRRLHGRTLESLIASGRRLEGEAALKMTSNLLSALDTVHRKDLLHRDISPSNIIVLDDGTPTLIDFGAARVAIGKVSQRLTAIARHGYTPPEQYDEYGIEPQSQASDFYALGATLYHAVTLSKPISSVMRRRESDRLLPITEAGAGFLPAPALAAIDKALNIDQAERWQDAKDWVAALDKAQGSGGETIKKRAPWLYVVGLLIILYIFFFVGF